MFEFFQNQKNNDELIGLADETEQLFNSFVDEFVDNHPYFREINEELKRDEPTVDDTVNTPSDLEHKTEKQQEADEENNIERLPHNLGPKDLIIKEGLSAAEEEIWIKIIDVLDDFDTDLITKKEFAKVYLRSVRSFLGRVAETATSNDDSREAIVIEVKNIIQLWIDYYTNHDRLTAHGFFYIHQTVHQTKMLLELYKTQTKRTTRTQRHLFEIGLKRLRIIDIQYIRILFSVSNWFSKYFALAPIHISELLFYHIPKTTCWINDPQKDAMVRRELYEGVQYAEYAYPDKRGIQKNTNQLTVLSPYRISYSKYNCGGIDGEFKLQGEFKGFVGVKDVNTHNQVIIIGFSGTECRINWGTDISQYFGNLPISYIEALGLVESVWRSTRNRKGYINPSIKVYGHSLGGGLMQFAVSNCSTDRITGFGYNSAGISNMNIINIINFDRKIYHLHKPNDVVFKLLGTHQLGYAIECNEKIKNWLKAHYLESIRKEIAKFGYNNYVELHY